VLLVSHLVYCVLLFSSTFRSPCFALPWSPSPGLHLSVSLSPGPRLRLSVSLPLSPCLPCLALFWPPSPSVALLRHPFPCLSCLPSLDLSRFPPSPSLGLPPLPSPGLPPSTSLSAPFSWLPTLSHPCLRPPSLSLPLPPSPDFKWQSNIDPSTLCNFGSRYVMTSPVQVVLPQTAPAPFTHSSNPNPSSSIPSFTTHVSLPKDAPIIPNPLIIYP
jgi:hypothetical protein